MLMTSDRMKSNGTLNAKVSINWRDDTDAEQVLNYIGITFNREVVRIDEIDWVASGANCARFTDPINEERVSDYGSGMAKGDTFPCPVIEKTPTGFLILGGNQRLNAAKRIGVESFPAFVCEGLTTVEREAAVRSLNSRHGWGTPKIEAIAHAVHMVKTHGMSVSDAAYLMVVSDSTINLHMRADNMRVLLHKHGVDASSLGVAHLSSIDKCKDERYQVQIAKIAIDSNATAEDVKSIVDTINQQKTPAKMDVKFKEWVREIPEGINTNNGIKKPRRKKFLSLLKNINDFLERGNDGTGFSNLDELQCSEQDLQSVSLLAAKVVLRLKTITGV